MLNDAGWRDWNRDGVRECVGCLNAPPDTWLAITLAYSDYDPVQERIATLIVQQLRKVGVQVDAEPSDSTTLFYQQFDAFLWRVDEQTPVSVDSFEPFKSANDQVGYGANVTSYANSQVDDLLAQADSTATCSYDERAPIYREVQSILQADQPYLWLFTVEDMVAARSGVLGFNPYPNAPFWNARDWRVVEAGE